MILIQTHSTFTYNGIRFCFVPFERTGNILTNCADMVNLVMRDVK